MEREQWGTRVGFIAAAVGSAIGLGNIWRFPFVAYENGGGAFLIPYLFAMLSVGIPMMILEFSLGQKFRGGAATVFKRIGSRFEFLGWFQVTICVVIAVYYVAVIGWTLSYMMFSLSQAWGTGPTADTSKFFYETFLNLKGSPSNLGSIRPNIAIAIFLTWIITFYCTFTGVKKGIEALSKIMMPLLFILVLILIANVITLKGSLTGVNYLFKPDFSKIGDFKAWSAAYGQIFFTLSVGFCIMFAYSSYLPKKSDITNNAIITVLCNCGFSILAGILIFGILGHMSAEQGTNMGEFKGGPGLAFVTLPAAINELPFPRVLGPLLFLSLSIAGISSHISIVEAIISSFMEKLHLARKAAASIVCGLGLIISLAFAFDGGLFLLDLVDNFANNISLLSSCLIELLIVGWLVRASNVRKYANSMSEIKINWVFDLCIMVISPAILTWILVGNFYDTITKGYGGYSALEVNLLGWGVVIISLILAFSVQIVDKYRCVGNIMESE